MYTSAQQKIRDHQETGEERRCHGSVREGGHRDGAHHFSRRAHVAVSSCAIKPDPATFAKESGMVETALHSSSVWIEAQAANRGFGSGCARQRIDR